MTRLERYREKVKELRGKRHRLMKAGRVAEAMALGDEIKAVEEAVARAERYEEEAKARPLIEAFSKSELDAMGIIPLMIECHLVCDFLTQVAYEVVDICKAHGMTDISLMPDLREILKRAEKFASFLTTLTPDLKELLVSNETFNASLHKKYVRYIEQRLK